MRLKKRIAYEIVSLIPLVGLCLLLSFLLNYLVEKRIDAYDKSIAKVEEELISVAESNFSNLFRYPPKVWVENFKNQIIELFKQGYKAEDLRDLGIKTRNTYSEIINSNMAWEEFQIKPVARFNKHYQNIFSQYYDRNYTITIEDISEIIEDSISVKKYFESEELEMKYNELIFLYNSRNHYESKKTFLKDNILLDVTAYWLILLIFIYPIRLGLEIIIKGVLTVFKWSVREIRGLNPKKVENEKPLKITVRRNLSTTVIIGLSVLTFITFSLVFGEMRYYIVSSKAPQEITESAYQDFNYRQNDKILTQKKMDLNIVAGTISGSSIMIFLSLITMKKRE